MTDNEIIKALECYKNADCMNCPKWSQEWHSGMRNDFLLSVLDLINRQKAEIESLTNKYEMAVAEREANVKGFTETLNTIKTEAIKEFAGEIEKKLDNISCTNLEGHQTIFEDYQSIIDIINITAKEMTEGEQ